MDDLTKKTIGIKINTALAAAKLKQKDLAKELNVTDNTVSYWCNGSRIPNTEQIIQIARALNVSTDYLLGLTDNPTTDKDERFFTEYTGLNHAAIKSLHRYNIGQHIVFRWDDFGTPDDFYASKDIYPNDMNFLNFLLSIENNVCFEFANYVSEYKYKLKKVEQGLKLSLEAEQLHFCKEYNIDVPKDLNVSDDVKELYRQLKYLNFDCIEAYKDIINKYCNEELNNINKYKELIYRANGGDS